MGSTRQRPLKHARIRTARMHRISSRLGRRSAKILRPWFTCGVAMAPILAISISYILGRELYNAMAWLYGVCHLSLNRSVCLKVAQKLPGAVIDSAGMSLVNPVASFSSKYHAVISHSAKYAP